MLRVFSRGIFLGMLIRSIPGFGAEKRPYRAPIHAKSLPGRRLYVVGVSILP
jgi:hypothetical protein